MDTLLGFLYGTPWYVYVILVYLIFVGIKSVRGGIISISKLFVIPILFTWMTYTEITSAVHANIMFIAACIGGLLLGSIIGFWQFKIITIGADRAKKAIKVKGSMLGLFFIIAAFIVKYYVSYNLSVNHNLSLQFTACLICASSVFTGLFIGRLVYALYRLRVGPHIDLTRKA